MVVVRTPSDCSAPMDVDFALAALDGADPIGGFVSSPVECVAEGVVE